MMNFSLIAKRMLSLGDDQFRIVLPRLSGLNLSLDSDVDSIKHWCTGGRAPEVEITVLAHAKFLQMGLWSPPDRLMAIKIIEEAKIEVFLPLQYFLVTLRYWERPVDMVEVSAYERELRVIAQAGYAAALKAVALLVQERGGPHSEVEGLMTSSASKGDPSALHWMGARALERGGQVEQALRFLSASAELGFADAIDKLFGLYSRGESGVARNYVKASHYGMLLRELYE